ncbi:MAG: pyrroloquinoline quinone biosynthesis peptide chaperone PqqD [Proteobacteria bacterium]|nr:pyrroloquinoline quinone biosynthesis peptide chaperone PqqD [Pseudomonadota bacterium]
MSEDQDQRVPTLKTMYRFQWEPAQAAHVLLYPEGMVKLSGSAGEILKRVDGERSIAAIIDELKVAFGGAPLDDDVRKFLAQAHSNGWITL